MAALRRQVAVIADRPIGNGGGKGPPIALTAADDETSCEGLTSERHGHLLSRTETSAEVSHRRPITLLIVVGLLQYSWGLWLPFFQGGKWRKSNRGRYVFRLSTTTLLVTRRSRGQR